LKSNLPEVMARLNEAEKGFLAVKKLGYVLPASR
jgi:hypothetical protein